MLELFRSDIIRAIVQQKWETYGFKKFFSLFVMYLLTLIVEVCWSILRAYETGKPEAIAHRILEGSIQDYTTIGVVLCFACLFIYHCYHEYRQLLLFSSTYLYLCKLWNLLDFVQLLLSASLLISFVLGAYFEPLHPPMLLKV